MADPRPLPGASAAIQTSDAIKSRLEAVKDATARSRFALLACTVAALSFLTAEFNAYLSWDRDFPLAAKFASPDSITHAAQKRLLDEWVSSTAITVPLLGVRVSVSDVTVLGSLTMYFLTLWLFFSVRRENRLIGNLLRETKDAAEAIRDLVYSGVVSYMVFTAVRTTDQPIRSLTQIPTARRSTGTVWYSVQLLFFLAPAAILLSMFFDIASVLWLAAPFREDHKMPPLDRADWIKFSLFMAVGASCFLLTLWNSIRISWWDHSTGKVMRQYRELLNKDV